MTAVRHQHWGARVYTEKAPDAVSWFEAVPRASLAMIERADALPLDAPIVAVGGGAGAKLAAELRGARLHGRHRGRHSPGRGALRERARDGTAAADRVTWVVADVRAHDFGRRFRLSGTIAPCSSSWSPPRTVAPTWRLLEAQP